MEYKKIEGLHAQTFKSIMQAFNAPFLSMFAALLHHIPDPQVLFNKCRREMIKIGENYCNDYDPEMHPNVANTFKKVGKDGWELEWVTRSGNAYRFGQADRPYNHDNWVEYPAYGTLAALIELLAHGTPVPYYCFDGYPYADNPYIKWQKPSAEERAELDAKARAAYLATLSDEDREYEEWEYRQRHERRGAPKVKRGN